eukprot:TRINITY_DN662_c1_g1_i3.p1 TRINITY_DN662_c1_g1~~TRINITY_DN662_c1_g1_i3.p1  ORF type:complete len:625 (+),score=188.21 TRINITY_DN662_c1_g1_i3:230-2104(+)
MGRTLLHRWKEILEDALLPMLRLSDSSVDEEGRLRFMTTILQRIPIDALERSELSEISRFFAARSKEKMEDQLKMILVKALNAFVHFCPRFDAETTHVLVTAFQTLMDTTSQFQRETTCVGLGKLLSFAPSEARWITESIHTVPKDRRDGLLEALGTLSRSGMELCHIIATDILEMIRRDCQNERYNFICSSVSVLSRTLENARVHGTCGEDGDAWLESLIWSLASTLVSIPSESFSKHQTPEWVKAKSCVCRVISDCVSAMHDRALQSLVVAAMDILKSKSLHGTSEKFHVPSDLLDLSALHLRFVPVAAAVIGACRMPVLESLGDTLLPEAVKIAQDIGTVEAFQLISSLLNKDSSVSLDHDLIKKSFSLSLSCPQGAIQLLKGLAMRSNDELPDAFVEDIIGNILRSPSFSPSDIKQLVVEGSFVLNISAGAVIRPGFRERISRACLGAIVPLLSPSNIPPSAAKDDEREKIAYLRGIAQQTFVFILSELPATFVVSNIALVVPILADVIGASGDDELLAASMNVFMLLVRNSGAEDMGIVFRELISRLFLLVTAHSRPRVRMLTIEALRDMSECLSSSMKASIGPMIIRSIVPALDDPKRLVRRAAAECRNAWIISLVPS